MAVFNEEETIAAGEAPYRQAVLAYAQAINLPNLAGVAQMEIAQEDTATATSVTLPVAIEQQISAVQTNLAAAVRRQGYVSSKPQVPQAGL